ncbi:MAG: flavoprotein [Candidatus Humimicrobiia bacterium]
MLKGKTIILGVTGGIAAYKSAKLVSRLKDLGANVIVIMTKNATGFITPLTLQTLSQNPVYIDMFKLIEKAEIGHISLSKRGDIIVIAPATANIIGKIVSGIADDLLTSTVMASTCPKLIAPAMHSSMYENPIVQQNIKNLEDLGFEFIGPETGKLVSGDIGIGRLAKIEDIINKIIEILKIKKR